MNACERMALKQFFSSYFHQDWRYDAQTTTEVVHEYKRTATPSDIRQLRKAIINYIDQKDERTLKISLESELGCYYLPSADGISARVWLEKVAEMLSEK